MRTPRYRIHKPSGRAFVELNGHRHYVGKHGTPEAEAEYRRLVDEHMGAAATEPASKSVSETHGV